MIRMIIIIFSCFLILSCIHSSYCQYLSKNQFECMFPEVPGHNVDVWVPLLNKVFAAYDITTPKRVAAFLTQTGIQTVKYSLMVEPTEGSSPDFPWGHNPLCDQYEGKCKYKGRGLLMIHSESNYERISQATGIDYVTNPDPLGRLPDAFVVSGVFWSIRGLNGLADEGDWASMNQRITTPYQPILPQEREAFLRTVSLCYRPNNQDLSRCGFTYVMEQGDDLETISTRYRLLPTEIIFANNLTGTAPFLPSGTRITIPKCSW